MSYTSLSIEGYQPIYWGPRLPVEEQPSGAVPINVSRKQDLLYRDAGGAFYWPFPDTVCPPDDYMRLFSKIAHEICIAKPTYWHCQAGVNRSAYALTYMICHQSGRSARSVIAELESCMTHTDVCMWRDGFREHLDLLYPGETRWESIE